MGSAGLTSRTHPADTKPAADAPRVLVADDQADVREALRLLLKSHAFQTETASSPAGVVSALSTGEFDAVLMDLNYARDTTSGQEGLDLLDRIHLMDPSLPVIVMTAWSSIELAVETMRRGARDFVQKPWENARLLAILNAQVELRRALRKSDLLEAENRMLRDDGQGRPKLIAESAAMRPVLQIIHRVAASDANVLITGEHGTGKEVVAQTIHALSQRSHRPMVSLNTGGLAEGLFESELFGHVKGAFTGAEGDRMGRLKAADHSTLFLDEIGNLPLHLQPKLLTALEQREVVPVGANKPIPIDVRVVAATNASADVLADEKRFRQDLLFRLNTIEIELPPLRERREDVPVLLDHYLSLYARKYDKPQRELPNHVLDVLVRHDWPGNVRALRHAAERAVIMADGDRYHIDDFPLPQRSEAASLAVVGDSLNLDQLERQMIERALRMHHFNVSLAASELGLSRGALYRRMEKHGL
jgi:DNA-binding NtrC family response regulator